MKASPPGALLVPDAQVKEHLPNPIHSSSFKSSRFLTIDALRGVAAFMVVLFHAFGGGTVFRMTATGELSARDAWQLIPGFGYIGVYLFFVISGFCIHLRWAKARVADPASNPKIDFFAFWRRRWIRLYPAYLAAITLYLVWNYYHGELHFDGLFAWNLISHLLMVHNFDWQTVFSIDGVFWTLAIEEQLYLLYFLLVYMRVKLGWKLTLSITFLCRFLWLGITIVIWKLTGYVFPFTEGSLSNWWIWALGAVAVENYFGVIRLPSWCHSRLATLILFGLAAGVHFGEYSANPTLVGLADDFEPFLWGGGFFFLINYAVSLEKTIKLNRLRHAAIAVCAFIGLFSYSLYLTHDFVLDTFAGRNVYALCILCVAFAYGFFLIFERPFMLYLARAKRA